MTGLTNGHNLYVSAYSAAWRIEVVDDDIHRGFEYVRLEHRVTCHTGTAR